VRKLLSIPFAVIGLLFYVPVVVITCVLLLAMWWDLDGGGKIQRRR
jgi:hypothetical protein